MSIQVIINLYDPCAEMIKNMYSSLVTRIFPRAHEHLLPLEGFQSDDTQLSGLTQDQHVVVLPCLLVVVGTSKRVSPSFAEAWAGCIAASKSYTKPFRPGGLIQLP